MDKLKEIVQWRSQAGAPIQVGEVVLTLKSQVLSIKLPFGGFVWNRPTAVRVEQNGRVTEQPIIDVTRLILWTLSGSAFLITTVAALNRLFSRNKKQEEESHE